MVTVRDATDADRDAISEVHVAAIRGLGSEAYDDRVVEAWAGDDEDRDPGAYPVGEPGTEFLVAEVAGNVVGFADVTGFEAVEDDGEDEATAAEDDYDFLDDEDRASAGEIRAVYVHSDVGRRGVGSALLSELERRAREREFRTLVLTASLNAAPFYEYHGYEAVATVTYEFGGEVPGEAVVMRKSLSAVGE